MTLLTSRMLARYSKYGFIIKFGIKQIRYVLCLSSLIVYNKGRMGQRKKIRQIEESDEESDGFSCASRKNIA